MEQQIWIRDIRRQISSDCAKSLVCANLQNSVIIGYRRCTLYTTIIDRADIITVYYHTS